MSDPVLATADITHDGTRRLAARWLTFQAAKRIDVHLQFENAHPSDTNLRWISTSVTSDSLARSPTPATSRVLAYPLADRRVDAIRKVTWRDERSLDVFAQEHRLIQEVG